MSGWSGWRGAAVIAVVVGVASPARAQVAAPATPPPAAAEPALDPAAPLAPLPGIGVDWPDLKSAPDSPSSAAGKPVADTRYTYRLDGLGTAETNLLRQRFEDASTLNAHDGEVANAAQLDRRARTDARLLVELLRAEGYYDARVSTRIDTAGARPTVVLAAEPGAVYRLKAVELPGLAAAGTKADTLRQAFNVSADAPADADAIATAEARLKTAIGKNGFAFGTVGEPELEVDHATRTATLAVDVAPGTARRFGKIMANANNGVFGADHIADIARFTPGLPYDTAALDDLRRALIQTGLVSVAEVKPVPDADPGIVDVAVNLQPAPPRTIAGSLGYGTGEGASASVTWTHRNLFPPEGALILQGILGTQEQLGGVTFRRNNFEGRDRVLTAAVNVSHTVRTAYDARTLDIAASLERQTNSFFQKKWTWSLGGDLAASDEREVAAVTGQAERRTFFIAALPTSLTYDGSDDLLNPTRGFRLGGRLSPELSLQGGVFGYARTQLDASVYRSVSNRVVLAGRVRFGSILGAPREQIAPSRRYYAGGGASVRGYGYQDIGPRDVNNDPVGGRSLNEFSIEARVRAFGNFGVVPFLDAGNIYTSTLPQFTGLRYGTGLGVRYYSSFGPIRVDVGTPVNPQPGDKRVAVYVSLGQAF